VICLAQGNPASSFLPPLTPLAPSPSTHQLLILFLPSQLCLSRYRARSGELLRHKLSLRLLITHRRARSQQLYDRPSQQINACMHFVFLAPLFYSALSLATFISLQAQFFILGPISRKLPPCRHFADFHQLDTKALSLRSWLLEWTSANASLTLFSPGAETRLPSDTMIIAPRLFFSSPSCPCHPDIVKKHGRGF
jgi:hypothetical protein